MKIDGKTRLHTLLEKYPYLLDFLSSISPEYARLKSPVLRKTVARFATLEKVAEEGKIPLEELLKRLTEEIKKKDLSPSTATSFSSSESSDRPRMEILKQIIKELHRGEKVEELQKKFAALIRDVGPEELARLEQQIIEEGIPEEEVKRLCDLHVKIFEETLEARQKVEAIPGHPVHTMMAENREAEKIMEEIRLLLERLPRETAQLEMESNLAELSALLSRLSEIEKHYLRKENQLFPLLEKRGITGPTRVMWAIHDDIRRALKETRELLQNVPPAPGPVRMIGEKISALLQMIRDMIYKEEKILFPASLEVLEESDWAKVRYGEEEIGHAWIKPGSDWRPSAAPAELSPEADGPKSNAAEGLREEGDSRAPVPGEEPLSARKPGTPRKIETQLSLSTGRLTPEQVDLILTHLPVDISFVDENDTVVYYSDTPGRIFPRSPGVIGRKVQNCHPPKSVHIVNRILEAFKKGEKDVAEFWIELNGRFVHIRYFAVRDDDGRYRGCLEVSQDVTSIRSLEGQKRLLDWN